VLGSLTGMCIFHISKNHTDKRIYLKPTYLCVVGHLERTELVKIKCNGK
jgi:hypothetical protein